MFELVYKIRRLEKWVKTLYCDIRGMNSNSTPQVITTSDSQYNLPSNTVTTILTFTGDESQLNLPSISSTKGLIVIVTNAGTQPITVTSPNGVWEGGMQMESTTMDIGSTARIVNDGVAYRINS